MVGNAHVEELVGAHARQHKNARIQVGQRPIHVAGDDPVEAPDRAQRAVDELGGEGRVAVGEVPVAARLTQRLGQQDVREGSLGLNLDKDLVGDAPGLVGATQLAVAVGVAAFAHRPSPIAPPRRIVSSGLAPRAHAAASIQDLPAGAT